MLQILSTDPFLIRLVIPYAMAKNRYREGKKRYEKWMKKFKMGLQDVLLDKELKGSGHMLAKQKQHTGV